MSKNRPGSVLYLVVCAAPPAQRIDELVGLLEQAGWNICVIPTPRAASWIDHRTHAQQTGNPVRHDYKQPGDPDTLPLADAVGVVPATFNTINKWSAGISDTFALGILNEAVGLKLPIVVAPYVKSSLAAHPEFDRNLKKLDSWGVSALPNEAIRMKSEPASSYSWRPAVEALGQIMM